MNFELSEEQILIQANACEAACRLNHSSSFQERWKQLAATGVLGTCVSENYGGSGLGAIEMLLTLEGIAKGNPDNGLSFAIAAHTLSCVIPINVYGSEQQKKNYIPSLIDGGTIAANAMTESESGSDVFNLQCKAVKNGAGYVINGRKVFISNSELSNLVLAYASTNASKGFFGGITAFIAEKNQYSIGTSFRKMGLESCSLGEIIFDNVELPGENVLGKEGSGAVIFNHSMEWERICLAGIHIGAMQRVLSKTIDFVKQRKSMGQSIGKFQGVSHSLADMQVLLEVSRNYAYKTARMLDSKKSVSQEAAITKLFVSNSVKQFMLQAMQIFGAYGYISDYGIEQEVRDALAATIYSGTSEIQKNIITSNLGI